MFNIYGLCGGGWSVFSGGIICILRRSIFTYSHCKHIQCLLRYGSWRRKSGEGIVFFCGGGYSAHWWFHQKPLVLARPPAYSCLIYPELFPYIFSSHWISSYSYLIFMVFLRDQLFSHPLYFFSFHVLWSTSIGRIRP